LRTWAVGDGFHDLHWNMLSWFGFCARVLRGFLFGWVERVVAGGFMLWLGRSDVERGIGGWVCGVVASCCLAFFGGLCDEARGRSWELSWVWVMVSGLLQVVVVCEGESCVGSVLEASCVCL
jgi:hypothetical protein